MGGDPNPPSCRVLYYICFLDSTSIAFYIHTSLLSPPPLSFSCLALPSPLLFLALLDPFLGNLIGVLEVPQQKFPPHKACLFFPLR